MSQYASEAFLARLLLELGLEDATRWMISPHPELGGQSPDEALAAGRRAEVERLLKPKDSLNDS